MFQLLPAFVAGYTDAEGCIGVNHQIQGKYSIWSTRVSFRQASPEIVHQLHAEFMGCLTIEKKKGKKPIHHLRWQALGDVQRFLNFVTPHLREKRSQAEAVLAFDPQAGDEKNKAIQAFVTDEKWLEVDPTLAKKAERQSGSCKKCTSPAISRGFCHNHYHQARKSGELTLTERQARLRIPTLDERAYFAGYFDGDGTITMRKHRMGHRYPVISFGQTRPNVVVALHEIYGGSLTLRDGENEKRRARLQWQLSQHGAVTAFLEDISDFTIEKKSGVASALAWCRAK